jgi:FkbH-like protein
MPWLVEPRADFRATLKSLRSAPEIDPASLVRLVNARLDLTQLGQLTRLLEKRGEEIDVKRLPRLKLAICASHTVDLLAEAIPATALRAQLHVQVCQSDYGQAAQSVLDPQSPVARFEPDFVLLSLDPVALGLDRPILDAQRASDAVQSALDYVKSLRDAIHANLGAGAVLHTLPTPLTSLFGNIDGAEAGSPAWLIREFNTRLRPHAIGAGDLYFDMAALAEMVGTARWHDPQRWHEAKLPIALAAIPLAADWLCRLLAAVRGRSRKCLVLDLDNTLWGGVIGDDGLEGIAIGQGSGAGEAHLAIQRLVRDLRDRGIVLAVCSKNEDANARLPFQHHEEMLLREDDIAVFVANWTDKATNLKYIAKALNIGTDALVFLDDNPAERERVRQELPEVAVPEVGDEPAHYPALLALAGYFETLSFGDEDRQRADMYQANAERASAMESIGNMEEYLASLEMVCSIRPFDDIGRARTAQLINKSNQFNLTTRRYTEGEVAQFQADPGKFTMQVRLVDRFGDNGMISVVIFDKGDEAWHCDTWLMSCRVLGRRVEEAVLAHVAAAAKAAGAQRLIGDYLPTPKNGLVERHFAKLGFDRLEDLPEGGTRWALDLTSYDAPDLPMRIEIGEDSVLDKVT